MIDSHPQPQPDGPPTDGQRLDPLRVQAVWLEREQPPYLVAALGRPGSSAWRALALEIDGYRRALGITSRVAALGPVAPARSSRGMEWLRLAQRIAQYQGVTRVDFDDA